MDDLMEMIEGKDDGDGEKEEKSWLNNAIAIAVVFTAVIMAISQMYSGNVAQAITETQLNINDQWAFFQSKSIKQHLYNMQIAELKLKVLSDRKLMSPEAAAAYDKQITGDESEVKRYDKEKDEISGKAKSLEKDYAVLNKQDDNFDMSDAIYSLSLALLAITALTKRKPLFFLSLLAGVGGSYFLYFALTGK